jgi:hypothetical protein
MAARKAVPPEPQVLVMIEDHQNDGRTTELFRNRKEAENWVKLVVADDESGLDIHNIDVRSPQHLLVTFYTILTAEVCEVRNTGIELIPKKRKGNVR